MECREGRTTIPVRVCTIALCYAYYHYYYYNVYPCIRLHTYYRHVRVCVCVFVCV